MNQPKVSIIIPVYNVEDYIGLTLDSLLNQTLKEIEIILIDDGSTDNSRQIIDDYSSATVDKYTLWSEDGDIDFGGDINIKIVYKEVGEYPDYTQGTWEFEFNCDNIHNLVEVTKKGGYFL